MRCGWISAGVWAKRRLQSLLALLPDSLAKRFSARHALGKAGAQRRFRQAAANQHDVRARRFIAPLAAVVKAGNLVHP